ISRQCVNTGWKALFHMPKVRWGVLGVAGIAVNKVIPAMQQGVDTEITAIASRELAKAQRAARALGITKAYGSYEELLADREIDVIYNPMPNHLHVPWSIKAAEAGKHVLCEKPIGLSVDEAKKLRDVRDRTGVKIGEAFMVRTHPQWVKALELVRAGRIGEMRSMMGFFSYSNPDPANIRNILAYGGSDLFGAGIEMHEIPVCDQYTVQGDLFSRAVRDGDEVPVPLESSIRNMAVIDAVVRAAESGNWEEVRG